MKIRTLVKWAYRRFGRRSFTSRQLIRDSTYRVDPFPHASVYSALHKSWKMGLLSREKLHGNRFSYRVSDWGRRYAEEGDLFQNDEVLLMLVKYVTRYGPDEELAWAESFLAPRLLQRFLRGKKATDIDPLTDVREAVDCYAQVLNTRFRNSFYQDDDELLDDCILDLQVLGAIEDLLQKVYPGFESLEWDKLQEINDRTKENMILDSDIPENTR